MLKNALAASSNKMLIVPKRYRIKKSFDSYAFGKGTNEMRDNLLKHLNKVECSGFSIFGKIILRKSAFRISKIFSLKITVFTVK